MMNQSYLVCQAGQPAAPSAPPASQKSVGQVAAVFLVGLTLCLVLLGAAMMMLRRHQHRVRQLGGLAEELEAAKERKKFKPDAWVEAGRRLDPSKPLSPEDDTVDFDPRELLPEDIQPPDDTPPQNGHGGYGGHGDKGGSGGSGGGGGPGGPGRIIGRR